MPAIRTDLRPARSYAESLVACSDGASSISGVRLLSTSRQGSNPSNVESLRCPDRVHREGKGRFV